MYGRTTQAIELLRPEFGKDRKDMEGVEKLKKQRKVKGVVGTA